MRLGLIARADSRGLGIQCKAFHDQMRPTKTLVVDCPSANPLPLRKDWYPEATWVHGLPGRKDFQGWLDGLDVVYTAETGYGNRTEPAALWDEAARRNVRTVLHANFEFLNRRDRPTIWAAPSPWRLNDFPKGAVHLPVPIETHHFGKRWPEITPHFLHIVGRPAVVRVGGADVERAGTLDLLQALQHVTEDITVTIRCQQPGYVAGLVRKHRIHTPKNVVLRLNAGDVVNYWELYSEGDVLVLPRRWGGLSLPTNEALGAGMPVIMPDISPNNAWLPRQWLVPARKRGSFMAKQRVDFHAVDPEALAALMDRFATDIQFFAEAREEAARLREAYSWDTLRPRYEKVLTGA